MLNKFLKIDWVLLFATILLLGIGLSVLYSISMANPSETGKMSIFWRQLVFAVIGMGGMLFFALSNYQHLKSKSTAIYFMTLLILVFVLIVGKNVRGTSGWIGLGSFHIQPVEIAKISMIIFLSSFISQKKMELGENGRLIASAILCGIMILFVIKQPDFGSAMVLVGIWVGMTLVSGVSVKKIGIMVMVTILISVVGWFNLEPYQKDRVMSFARPGSVDLKGAGYNVNQSMIAVGSGGLIGKGIGHGSQSQLNFLPEKHTDFIFASIAEELGLLGSLFVIGLFGIMFYRMRMIAANAPDNFGFLLVIGIMLMFFVQVWENIGMNIGIMPVTGIPLPLLSYGGSSLIVTLSSIGILSSINARRETLLSREDYSDSLN